MKEAQAIYVNHIEIIKALKASQKKDSKHTARDNHSGLTLWQFLFRLTVKGIAPVVSSKAAVLAQGSASIITSGAGGLISLMHHAAAGPSSKRHDHLSVHNKQNSMWDHMMVTISGLVHHKKEAAPTIAAATVTATESMTPTIDTGVGVLSSSTPTTTTTTTTKQML
jgi:hypothetical protein